MVLQFQGIEAVFYCHCCQFFSSSHITGYHGMGKGTEGLVLRQERFDIERE